MSAHIPKYFFGKQKKRLMILTTWLYLAPKSVQNLAFLMIIVQYISKMTGLVEQANGKCVKQEKKC